MPLIGKVNLTLVFFLIHFIFWNIWKVSLYQCNTKITDQEPQFSLSPAQIPDL